MKHRSSMFQEGQRLEGTMLTIINSISPTTWAMIRCKCDCGNEVEITYMRAYLRQYSCGCKRRPRTDTIDHTGIYARNGQGNRGYGRMLTVVCRDPDTQQWAYVCSCCAEVFLLPRGMERGLRHSLRELAGEECPNFLEFTPVSDIGHIVTPLGESRGISRVTLAEEWAPHFPPDQVKRDKHGNIEGFYGQPTSVPDWVVNKRREMAALNAPVAEDPEGFASEFTAVEPTS